MKWTDFLTEDVYTRLGNCRTIKRDFAELVNARWLYMKKIGKDKEHGGWTKADALVYVLELLDCNGIDTDLTRDEFDSLKFEF